MITILCDLRKDVCDKKDFPVSQLDSGRTENNLRSADRPALEPDSDGEVDVY